MIWGRTMQNFLLVSYRDSLPLEHLHERLIGALPSFILAHFSP